MKSISLTFFLCLSALSSQNILADIKQKNVELNLEIVRSLVGILRGGFDVMKYNVNFMETEGYCILAVRDLQGNKSTFVNLSKVERNSISVDMENEMFTIKFSAPQSVFVKASDEDPVIKDIASFWGIVDTTPMYSELHGDPIGSPNEFISSFSVLIGHCSA